MKTESPKSSWVKRAYRSRYLLLMMLFPFLYLIIFQYIPMYGVQIAFRDYNPYLGILKSPWVGFAHFIDFFTSNFFGRLLRNTVVISLLQLLLAFPAAVILALMLNELQNKFIKKSVQTIAYLPHFISSVVVSGLVLSVLATRTGIVNQLLLALGMEEVSFMTQSSMFPIILVLTEIWQNTGWGSIIYLAAMTSIDPTFYEAAVVDGASRWQQIRCITLPCIMPTVIIQFILKIGGLFTVGYQKILLLYNPQIYENADVIGTYVYRRGLMGLEYSFGAAVDLFNTILNLLMLLTFNAICRKISSTSLW